METNTQQKWANPTPAALVGLAVACFGFYATLSGKVEAEAAPLLGIWLLGGFVIQLIVALVDLKSGNMTGGNTYLYFSAFFMLVGGLEMLLKWYASNNGMALDTRIDGWAWMALTIATWIWTIAYLKSTALLTLIVLCLDVALPFIALADMAVIPKDMTVISAWALLGSGVIAIYLSGALIVNDTFGKNVLPIPGPIIKPRETKTKVAADAE